MRTRWIAVAAVVGVVAILLGTFLLGLPPFTRAASSSASVAPDFTLQDIYGRTISLSSYRNTTVVVTEFTSLSCSECQIVEKSLASIYGGYNATGTSKIEVISIYIEPQFGDTIPALKAYHAKNNITWEMAQDTPSLAVSRSYGVQDIPTVVVIDKKGDVVYDVSGVQNDQQLSSTISNAISGKAAVVSLVTVSVFGLAVVAGVTTFFSPCAFPMFPGYMSLFLGLNSGRGPGAGGTEPEGSYGRAARKAVVAGSVTAFGMIVVFLAIGVALIYAASLISGYIPFFLVIVGAILIGLGALLLTNLQYWRIITPVQRFVRRLRGQDPNGAPTTAPPAGGEGFHLKLFGYGVGYAAAAAGCVAPVIFSAVVAGLAIGLIGGLVNILIFALTAAALMISVTVLLAVAGKRFVNQLNAYTPVIKKVSAIVLVVVGVYLVYFYYTAWGF